LVGSSSEFDPLSPKAEEMLLCEVIIRGVIKHHQKHSAYEGAVQQDCEKLLSLARQLPTDCLISQAYDV
jgi:hypothetical protein